jgi:hypothetical protein
MIEKHKINKVLRKTKMTTIQSQSAHTSVIIEIHYRAGNSRISQKGSFRLRGKKPEHVAFEFWQQLRTKLPYYIELERIIVNGHQEITELVKEIESQELKNIDSMWTLPF